jgi:hypothetical protein
LGCGGRGTPGACRRTIPPIILKTAVEGEKDVQDIDVHERFEKLVVTLLVMRAFSNFPGALRACGYFRHPTAVFRFMSPLFATRKS